MSVRRFLSVLGLLLLLGMVPGSRLNASAPALPAGFTRETMAQGLTLPTAFVFTPDGILVAQKGGVIQVVQSDGALRAQPYVTLHVSAQIERGLAGIALDPKYATRPFVYVYYTTGPGALNYGGAPVNRVSRFRTVNGLGTGEEILLDNIPSPSGKHNGGDLQFGPDGKLYVAVGDGDQDAGLQAQVRQNLLGKILRLNPGGSIPPDNPFATKHKMRHEIYAYGFRNPFRMTFRAKTQSLLAADVGLGQWEEADSVRAGGNYGWPMFEGPCPYDTHCDPAQTNFGGTIPPAYYYDSSIENPSGIIGGVFAETSSYHRPYKGAYFFGDYARWVHVARFDKHDRVKQVLDFDAGFIPVQFRVGPDKNVWALDLGGNLYRYIYQTP